jgi:hypothetical protein
MVSQLVPESCGPTQVHPLYVTPGVGNLIEEKSRVCLNFPPAYDCQKPIMVTARFKAWTVFARSNAGIVGSNPTRGIDVCVRLFCVCVVLCVGSGLAMGWSPVQGVLPTVYMITKLKELPGPNEGL